MDLTRVPTEERLQDLRFWRDALFFAVLVLLGLGLVLAATIEGPRIGLLPALQARALRIGIGLLVLFLAARFRWALLRPRMGLLYAFVVGLCLLPVLFVGATKGATRWIELGPVSFQPVEMLKPLTVMAVAEFALRRGERLQSFWGGFVPAALPVLGAVGVLLLQPDVGHSLFLMAITAAILLLAGVRLRYLLAVGLVGVVAMGLVMLLGFFHTQSRIARFLAAEPAFQIRRAQVAMSEGGLMGVGPGAGWAKDGYVPEARNDFVLAILGNEFGLFGSLLALACFSVIFVASLRIARAAQTRWEGLVAFGLGYILVLQVALNVLGVTHTIPEKGIDLPLLSSGGTNLVFALASMGILAGIASRVLRDAGEGEFSE